MSDGIGISEIAKGQKGKGQWLCPLCAQKVMKYGTSCKEWPDCGNKLHVTGETYRKELESRSQQQWDELYFGRFVEGDNPPKLIGEE